MPTSNFEPLSNPTVWTSPPSSTTINLFAFPCQPDSPALAPQRLMHFVAGPIGATNSPIHDAPTFEVGDPETGKGAGPLPWRLTCVQSASADCQRLRGGSLNWEGRAGSRDTGCLRFQGVRVRRLEISEVEIEIFECTHFTHIRQDMRRAVIRRGESMPCSQVMRSSKGLYGPVVIISSGTSV